MVDGHTNPQDEASIENPGQSEDLTAHWLNVKSLQQKKNEMQTTVQQFNIKFKMQLLYAGFSVVPHHVFSKVMASIVLIDVIEW